jgi:hypothetical protein
MIIGRNKKMPITINQMLWRKLLAAAFLISASPSPAEEPAATKGALDIPFVKGATTLAVLPDTQYYAQKYPRHFEAQTKWIADHHKERNIVYALHLGDIVQHDAPREWDVAVHCMRMLDGKVPYVLTPVYKGTGLLSRLERKRNLRANP